MRALSLTQPWAHAVIHLGKRVENRDWRGCSFRGPLLIHAAKSVGTVDDFDGAVDAVVEASSSRSVHQLALGSVAVQGEHQGDMVWHPSPLLPRGGVVGRARVDGVIRNRADFDAYAKRTPDGERQRAWWFGGFALVLLEVQPVPFVPVKGALGFFQVDDGWLAEQWAGAGPSELAR